MSTPRLTIFSLPRGFRGGNDLLQRNAIASWTRLPGVEVVLLGEEEGLAEAAMSLSVRHEPQIARNELGTPLISDAFARFGQLARAPLVMFVNTDIILTGGMMDAIDALARAPFPQWLAVGQRYDLDQREPLGGGPGWEADLLADVQRRGSLHGKAGLDYFVLPRNFAITFPPLAVGRPGWDSWLMFAVRHAGFALVDLTDVVTAIHQNHPPAYTSRGAEAMSNRRAAGGVYHMGTLRDANWRAIRSDDGEVQFRRRLAGQLWFAPPVRALLAVKRALQR